MKMKTVLLLLTLFNVNSIYAQRTIIKDTFGYKGNFVDAVEKGMKRHHARYRKNDFYNYNVSKEPVYESEDSIVYKIKLLTPGTYLWDATGTFINRGENIVCEIKNIKLLKKSVFMKGVDYVDVAVDDMEPTKGNKINLQ